MRLAFDIEANGFIPEVTKVHCIAAQDIDTDETYFWGPDEIPAALEKLAEADELFAHFGLSYDFPVLARVLGWHPRPGCNRRDTVVMSRLMRPSLYKEDLKYPPKGMERKDYGSHSLKAWGIRLGEHKATYTGGFEEYTPEMKPYVIQDVATLVRLIRHLKPWEYPSAPLELEHRIADICYLMQEGGVLFDTKKAQDLAVELTARRDELERTLVAKFGSWTEVDRVVVPKRDNRKLGYTKGVPVTKFKEVTFNPGSRQHIELKLREAGWKPEEFTATGRAKVNEESLIDANLPGCKDLCAFLLVQKRLSQLQDGDNAWLRLVDKDNLLHPRYNPLGTATGRASHNSPNISQVPAVRKGPDGTLAGERGGWGLESRSLFTVPEGWRVVGADMSGAQLRCLAHDIAHFDKGDYAKVVCEGDIHTFHMEAAAPHIASRANAKTTIYALIFGAYDKKLGDIQGKSPAVGKAIRTALETKIPGFGKVTRAVARAASRGFIKGLDGRIIPIDSEHSALNYRLQSSEAILTKRWIVSVYDELCARFTYGWGRDFVFMIWNHDELEVACRAELATDIAEVLVRRAKVAGEPYGFKCPLASEAKIGINWAEVH